MKVKLLVAGVSLAFCSAGALAQTPTKSAAPGKADPALTECVTKFKGLNREVDSAFRKAKLAGKIDAKEEADFKRMEASIAKLSAALFKDGLTLAECNEMTKEYEKEKAAVVAMGAVIEKRTSELSACRSKNAALDKEVDDRFNKVKAEGKTLVVHEAEFKRMEDNIAKLKASLTKDGFTLADCNTMTKEYEKEKVAVDAMVSMLQKRGSELKACHEYVGALNKEVDEMFKKAKAAGKIDAKEELEFKRMEASIIQQAVILRKGGFTLADCKAMTKAFEKEKAAVSKMADEIAKRAQTPPKK